MDYDCNAKSYLEQIRKLDMAANDAMRLLASIEADVKRVTPYYGHHAGGKGKGDKADAIVRLMETRERCNDAIDAYADYKSNCIALLMQMDDPTSRSLLIARYVDYKDFDQMAESMGYERRQIFRLHGIALAKFGNVLKKQAKS